MKYDKSDIEQVSLITQVLGITITSDEYEYLCVMYNGFVKQPIEYRNLKDIVINALNERSK